MGQSEVVNDDGVLRYPCVIDKYGARPAVEDTALASVPILGGGTVVLLSTYGSDQMIADTARVSYGKGTKKNSNTRALIRYLMKHRHTSPFEHAEVSFYLRIPIFVMRQLVRHRTANINEYSARYSEMADDFYVPAPSHMGQQSTSNKQGREGTMTTEEADFVGSLMYHAQQQSFDAYQKLLGQNVSRELSRVVTSVGMFTELYWKCDLHNFLHMLKLRTDPHAQQEIRDLAYAMYACITPFFPETLAAWEDYVLNAHTFSAQELRLLSDLINWREYEMYGVSKNTTMSDREFTEFQAFLKKLGDI